MKINLELDPEESKGLMGLYQGLYQRDVEAWEARRREQSELVKEVLDKALPLLPLLFASKKGESASAVQAVKTIQSRFSALDPEKVEGLMKALRETFGEEGVQEIVLALSMILS